MMKVDRVEKVVAFLLTLFFSFLFFPMGQFCNCVELGAMCNCK